jgi:hypothetical protein
MSSCGASLGKWTSRFAQKTARKQYLCISAGSNQCIIVVAINKGNLLMDLNLLVRCDRAFIPSIQPLLRQNKNTLLYRTKLARAPVNTLENVLRVIVIFILTQIANGREKETIVVFACEFAIVQQSTLC